MRSIPTRVPGVSLSIYDPAKRLNKGIQRSLNTSLINLDSGQLVEPHFITSRPAATRTLTCLDGEVYAIVVDLRRESPTRGRWIGLYLSSENRRVLKLATDVACGWITTGPRAKLRLTTNRAIHPEDWRSLDWDDRELELEWPEQPIGVVGINQVAESVRVTTRVTGFSQQASGTPPTWSSVQSLRRRRKKSRSMPMERPMSTRHRPAWPAISPSPVSEIPKPRPVASARLGRHESLSQSPPNQDKPLILLIGSAGQLGRDLFRHLRSIGTVVGASRSPERNGILPVPIEVDISRPASLRQVIRQVRPRLIVNASGLTDADRAEAEPRLAQLINATAPAIMAEEAECCGAAIVHYCTDMVFSGRGERPWREIDETEPICQYARTKCIGTEAIRSSRTPHLILRGGWLYSTHGENYIRRTIDMSVYRNSLSLACDHFGSPTSTSWLAEVTTRILASAGGRIFDWLGEHGGLYHCAALGYASRAEVGEHVLAECRQHRMPVVTRSIQSVPLSSLPSLANRPTNCRLDCSRISMQLGIQLPRWQDQLSQQMNLMIDGQASSLHAVA